MNDPSFDGSDTGGKLLTGDEVLRIHESSRSVSLEQLKAYVLKNPQEALSPEVIREVVNDYLTENPQLVADGWLGESWNE